MAITPTIEQQRFIDHYDRSILLQACVGTGKTFALAHRVAKAIKSGIPAERILCVTFTNRAAEEMRQRIHLYCPNDSHKVVTKTLFLFLISFLISWTMCLDTALRCSRDWHSSGFCDY